MSNGGVYIIDRPHDECPVCGLIKPASFLVCRICFREIPFGLFVEQKTAEHNCWHKQHRTPASVERSRLADAAVISYLKQHGSAL